MRVVVYIHGDDALVREYDLAPGAAVTQYCVDTQLDETTELIVEPADDEAEALPGWQDDPDGPCRLFRAVPVVHYDMREVASFNPAHRRSP